MTRYIQRHSLLTRVTHGVAAVACILLAVTGVFVFVPSLGGGIMGGEFTQTMRMLHRVLAVPFILVPLFAVLKSPAGFVHLFKEDIFGKWDKDDVTWAMKFPFYLFAPGKVHMPPQHHVKSAQRLADGALLFFCLTGVDPKPGIDMREQCEMRGIPASLTDVICMAMALDPAKRFASAEALGRATRAAYDLSRPVRPPAPPVRTPASETVLTPQGLQNPAGPPGPAASAACGLLSRVPESLGRIWNTLVCFSLLVFFAGSHFAVFHPTGANQSYPTWLLIIEYFFFVDGLMVLMHFALLDKRRLRRRFALLDSYRGKKLAKLWLKALGVLLLCMIVIVAVANATGVVDTSAT